MDCSIQINGESVVANLRPRYSPTTLSLWNLESSSPSETQIRDTGPHISFELSRKEFVSLTSTGKWPSEHIQSQERIFGQIADKAGRAACDYGSNIRYIDSLSFDSSINGGFLSVVIHGTTLPPEMYKSRTAKEMELLSRINFLVTITVPFDELPLFVGDETVLESLKNALPLYRAG